MILLLVANAFAVDRETVLEAAAQYTMHEWTMTEVNETAVCSSDYVSDFTAGTWKGLPYDWGGYFTLDEFDAAIDEGLGAGSHSVNGILECTAGVDCSGFLSQIWDVSHNSTSSMHSVASDISLAELKRADAVNDAGSHVVLFAYETDAGNPVFFEASGSGQKVRLNGFSGWSYLSGFVPIRLDGIEEGRTTGTAGEPVEIGAFPYEDIRFTAGSASDAIDRYSCAPTTDESGPEMLYHFYTPTGGRLRATVSDDEGIDVDLHVMTAATGATCLVRDDTEVDVEVPRGHVWLSLDTYTAAREFPGPYLLNATFDGDIEPIDPPEDTGDDTEVETDVPEDTDIPAETETSGWTRVRRQATRGCETAPAASGAAVFVAMALLRRRRR